MQVYFTVKMGSKFRSRVGVHLTEGVRLIWVRLIQVLLCPVLVQNILYVCVQMVERTYSIFI